MTRIRWTRRAVTDLDGFSERARARIIHSVDLLAEFPQLGSVMDGPYRLYRQLLIDRYRVIYRIVDREIMIAYIRHGARQLTLRLVRDDD
ncbi:MAG TPA: type II toxin-antitoxin system RelE/ParE family toxin [Kofleriaceae bacterium]|nr:type II toxin-antitoxin system RelE/ParE family toxin [Kofleriaceae bacterium]